MFRNRWATGDKYTYYFNESGVAIARQWLTQDGKKYYFLSNSTMAKGWQKIGKYYYYFSKKTGVMAKNTWIGKYYVNSKGQRVKSQILNRQILNQQLLKAAILTNTKAALLILNLNANQSMEFPTG